MAGAVERELRLSWICQPSFNSPATLVAGGLGLNRRSLTR